MSYAAWSSQSLKIVVVFSLSFGAVGVSRTPAYAQSIEFWNKPCLKDYKKWKSAAKHKAFAVSNANAGGGIGQGCGSSWGYSSKSEAESAAISSCQATRPYRSGKCRVTKSE